MSHSHKGSIAHTSRQNGLVVCTTCAQQHSRLPAAHQSEHSDDRTHFVVHDPRRWILEHQRRRVQTHHDTTTNRYVFTCSALSSRPIWCGHTHHHFAAEQRYKRTQLQRPCRCCRCSQRLLPHLASLRAVKVQVSSRSVEEDSAPSCTLLAAAESASRASLRAC